MSSTTILLPGGCHDSRGAQPLTAAEMSGTAVLGLRGAGMSLSWVSPVAAAYGVDRWRAVNIALLATDQAGSVLPVSTHVDVEQQDTFVPQSATARTETIPTGTKRALSSAPERSP